MGCTLSRDSGGVCGRCEGVGGRETVRAWVVTLLELYTSSVPLSR